jgi:hypothetical protein
MAGEIVPAELTAGALPGQVSDRRPSCGRGGLARQAARTYIGGMKRKAKPGLYGEVAVRAMEDALYQRMIDRCWDELKLVFERRDVQEAEATIMRAIAEAFAPRTHKRNGPRSNT